MGKVKLTMLGLLLTLQSCVPERSEVMRQSKATVPIACGGASTSPREDKIALKLVPSLPEIIQLNSSVEVQIAMLNTGSDLLWFNEGSPIVDVTFYLKKAEEEAWRDVNGQIAEDPFAPSISFALSRNVIVRIAPNKSRVVNRRLSLANFSPGPYDIAVVKRFSGGAAKAFSRIIVK